MDAKELIARRALKHRRSLVEGSAGLNAPGQGGRSDDHGGGGEAGEGLSHRFRSVAPDIASGRRVLDAGGDSDNSRKNA